MNPLPDLESWRQEKPDLRRYRFDANREPAAAVIEYHPQPGLLRNPQAVYVVAVADPEARAAQRNPACRLYLFVPLGTCPLEMLRLALEKWRELYASERKESA